MSTRAAILRAEEGGGRGVYHHFDGYPRGLGQTLLGLHARQFDSDHRAMAAFLIDDHPAGWSTIVSRDWSQAPGFVNTHDLERTCLECGVEGWKHYRQHYASHGVAEPEGTGIMIFGHSPNIERPEDYRPQCYCHGDRTDLGTETICVDDPADEGWCVPEVGNCSPLFIEWAYRISAEGIEVWEGARLKPGHADRDPFYHHRLGLVAWGDTAAMNAMEDLVYGVEVE